MDKYKIILNQGDRLDENYAKMVNIIMQVSELDKAELSKRKDSWVEEVVELHSYEITLELNRNEYIELNKNFKVLKL